MKVDEFEREIRAVQIQMNSATTALRMQSLGKAMEGLANDKMQLNANVVQLRDKKMEYVAIWNRLSIAQAALHLKADALQSAQQMARDNGELPLPCSYTCSSTWIRGHCSDAHVTTVEWLCRNTYSSRCRSRLSRRHTSHQARHLYLTAIIVSNLQETWNLDNLATMLRRERKPLPIGTPEEYIGRNSAIDAIQSAAMENFRHRTSKEHTDFTFLVASGHILSGKTRSGIETPRLVEELCSKLSTHGDERGTRLEFTKPVYLLIDFMETSKVNPDFDCKHQGASVTLGARLMCAFYKCDTLKVITHDQALKHIIDSILCGIGDNDSLIVPIVIHFNEHGQFVRRLNELGNREQDGKSYFEEMLLCIGESATSTAGAVSELKFKGRFFLVPITTGTSQKDTSFSQLSTYGIKTVPLPPLSLADSRLLASAFLNSRDDKQEILDDTVFQIALADCGGLPGLVHLLCNEVDDRGKLFVVRLHAKVRDLITDREGWDYRWNSLYSIFFARPKLTPGDMVEVDYSVSHALDSGTVHYNPDEGEIGLVPVFLGIFNLKARKCVFNPLLLKEVTEAHHWTGQDFERTHLLYHAAIMRSLQIEQSRFQEITLGTFLRHVQPGDNTYLGHDLVLLPGVTFDSIEYKCDDRQCLDWPPRRECHSVDTTTENQVILSKTGTPFVDGYLNLRLRTKGGNMTDFPTTLFVHYEHSTMRRAPKLKVSQMNKVIKQLHTTLVAMQWDTTRLWLLLWVTNRPIHIDARCHEKLLWVGRDDFEKHAPLIARRGLVRSEGQGLDESGGCWSWMSRMCGVGIRNERRAQNISHTLG